MATWLEGGMHAPDTRRTRARRGAPVEIALATLKSGLICKWVIAEPIRKRYRFG